MLFFFLFLLRVVCVCLRVFLCVLAQFFSWFESIFLVFFSVRGRKLLLFVVCITWNHNEFKERTRTIYNFVRLRFSARMGVFTDFSILTGNFPFLVDFVCVFVLCAKQHFFSTTYLKQCCLPSCFLHVIRSFCKLIKRCFFRVISAFISFLFSYWNQFALVRRAIFWVCECVSVYSCLFWDVEIDLFRFR